jgi:error-prone DNA polymerase
VEPLPDGRRLALRLGLREIRGFREDAAQRIETARAQRPFADIADLCCISRVEMRPSRPAK